MTFGMKTNRDVEPVDFFGGSGSSSGSGQNDVTPRLRLDFVNEVQMYPLFLLI